MRRSVTAGFAIAIAALSTVGCGAPPASSQPARSSATSGSATPSSAHTTTSPDPMASLPDVPAGLPVMPGAEAADPDPAIGVMARWLVDAIAPDVYRYYLDALPAAGFVITDRLPGGGAADIRFT